MARVASWTRDTAAVLDTLTTPNGQSWVIAVDTDAKQLRIYDGTTPGGVKVARSDATFTLGSTSVALGGTTSTVTGLTLSSPTLSGTVTLPGGSTLLSTAANNLSVANSTNPQVLRIFNTRTDAANGEWSYSGSWSGNIARYGTDQNGTGTSRNVQVMTGGTVALAIDTSQLIAFGPSAAFTSSYPALKRSTTIAQFRLADDSGYTPVEAATVRTATAYAVGTLPAAGTAGRRAYVTDANATTFLTIVAAGGANVVPVFDDGTNWRIG